MRRHPSIFFFFFFNDTATTEIYTLSLHDALPISTAPPPSRCNCDRRPTSRCPSVPPWRTTRADSSTSPRDVRSEEHTSELQSQSNLVCRLLLEKKKKIPHKYIADIPIYCASVQFR